MTVLLVRMYVVIYVLYPSLNCIVYCVLYSMDSRHVIISIVDSADMTNYDGVINTERSRRWAKFIDSVSTQTKQPDVVVYCPTGKGEYWDDIKSVASKRLGELEDTTLIFGPSLEGSNTLSVCLCRSRFHPRTPNLITVSPT